MGRAFLRQVSVAALLAAAAGAPAGCGAVLNDDSADRVELVPAPATLHRLTRAQYQETVRSLLGADLRMPADLEADTPLHGFTSVGASALTISPRAAELFEAAAQDLARQVMSDATRRSKLLGKDCSAKSVAEPCVREFLKTFGRRAFRRPLTLDEQESLQKLAAELSATLGSPLSALEGTVSAILQSPHFLFRVELGEPDPSRPDEPTRLRYTSIEMASRLSYLLWGTMPDDELLQTAENGELTTTTGIQVQAARLLADPRAKTAVLTFFAEYFNLARLDQVSKDKGLFPQYTPSLVTAMREEVLRNVADVVFTRDTDYRELLRGTSSFVNAELAKLYELPPPGEGYAKVELPEESLRGGLLGSAAILALNAHATMTSPTHRGKFVREYLLCQDVPPPPPGVLTSLEPSMGMGPVTLRERLAKHREDPQCGGCHARIDPIGLGLENFDPIGAFRKTDSGLPIDASAELDGVSFVGARQLGQAIAQHPRLAECVARQLYRHATGHVEEVAEQGAIAELGRSFDGLGFRFQRLLLQVVMSDAFRLATQGAPAADRPEGGV